MISTRRGVIVALLIGSIVGGTAGATILSVDAGRPPATTVAHVAVHSDAS